MSLQFIKRLREVFLVKNRLLAEIIQLIDSGIRLEQLINHLNELQQINQNILSLNCDCYIVDVNEYFLDWKNAIKIEFRIEGFLIEICQDNTLNRDLTSGDLRDFFNKAEEINRYIDSILVYVFGKDLETAKDRIMKAMDHNDYKLVEYLTENEFLTPLERLETIRFLLSYVGFQVRIEEPKIREFLVGEHIGPLEAQVVTNQNIFNGLIEDIKNEHGYSFIWYVGQTHKETAPIHAGRVAQISDNIIPLDFSGRDTYITVVLFNKEMQEVARYVISIRLIGNKPIRGMSDVPLMQRLSDQLKSFKEIDLGKPTEHLPIQKPPSEEIKSGGTPTIVQQLYNDITTLSSEKGLSPEESSELHRKLGTR